MPDKGVRAPSVSEERAVEEPVKLRFPPRVKARDPRRLAMLLAALSRVSVAPGCWVIKPVPPMPPTPLKVVVPAFRMRGATTAVLADCTLSIPDPIFVIGVALATRGTPVKLTVPAPARGSAKTPVRPPDSVREAPASAPMVAAVARVTNPLTELEPLKASKAPALLIPVLFRVRASEILNPASCSAAPTALATVTPPAVEPSALLFRTRKAPALI